MELPNANEIQNQFLLHSHAGLAHISQINKLLKSLRLDVNADQMKEIVNNIKCDSEGRFTLEAFTDIPMFNPNIDEYTLDDVIRSFSIFDDDQDGMLTLKEFEHAMTHNGEDDLNYHNGNTKMNGEEFQQMRQRLRNFGLIEDDKYINIERLSRVFLGIEEPDSPTVEDFN